MVQQPPFGHCLDAPQSLHEIFPPVQKSHIQNCAFASWHGRYRSVTPKARVISLNDEFLTYLREDGIILPDDEDVIQPVDSSDSDSDETYAPTNFPRRTREREEEEEEEEGGEDEGDEEEEEEDKERNPTRRFPALHAQIKATIADLGGSVTPKLNWSSPKDALFMAATHTLECWSPGDVYLLLKSSDFITHDLEHAFDDTDPLDTTPPSSIRYHLVLRKFFDMNCAMEFRVFVAGRRIVGIGQRDPNYHEFLAPLRSGIRSLIVRFFEENLEGSFPDEDFVFDVYVTPNVGRVWLVDINPFAPRTDSGLFSWAEILRRRVAEDDAEGEVEVRLVESGDPGFGAARYSASKLPREVVEAGGQGEEAVWEFARRWRGLMEKTEKGKGDVE